MKAKNIESWLDAQEKNFSPNASLKKAISDYQTDGGLPGCFFIRNKKLKSQKIAEQLQTILDRDLRELVSTRLSYTQILEFVEALAKQEGTQISYTKLLNDTGVSSLNAKKLISALESVFLIRQLKVEGGKKGWIFYFEDQAESLYFSKKELDSSVYFSGFLYRNIRAEFEYSDHDRFRFFHYLTKHNTSLPFGVEWDDSVLGFLPLKSSLPAHAETMAAQSFLKRYANSKVVMIHPKAKMKKVSERIVVVPETLFF